MRRLTARIAAVLALLTLAVGGPARAQEEPVTLFAAASTTEAVNEIAEAFAASGGGSLRPVFASSSTLARQIAQGAPADLYLAANVTWMDHLEEQAAIVAESRVRLLRNRLVLVAPANSDLQLRLAPGLDLAGLLGDSRRPGRGRRPAPGGSRPASTRARRWRRSASGTR